MNKKKLKKKKNKWKKKLVWKYYYNACRRLPIKKGTIAFESFLGRAYSDNPKAIYEYMLNEEMDFEYVWFLNKPGKELPGNCKQVKKVSLKYIYYLARSEFIITNSRITLHYRKRKGQKLIQTWHGTPLKKLVLDMNGNQFPNTTKAKYLVNFLRNTMKWDYLISPNAYSSEVFKNCFAFEKKIVESGYPRNDVLTNYTDEMVEEYKTKIGIPKDKKVLLYTPTFRENHSFGKGKYRQKILLDLEQIAHETGWVILLRTHYLVTENMKIDSENIIDVGTYDDINDLYLVSDAMMTDYSSTMFDYAILNRPLITFAYDLEEYEGELRGFYLDYDKDIPAQNIANEDELINILNNIEVYKNEYKEEYDEFRRRFTYLEDGNASKRFVDEIILGK